MMLTLGLWEGIGLVLFYFLMKVVFIALKVFLDNMVAAKYKTQLAGIMKEAKEENDEENKPKEKGNYFG